MNLCLTKKIYVSILEEILTNSGKLKKAMDIKCDRLMAKRDEKILKETLQKIKEGKFSSPSVSGFDRGLSIIKTLGKTHINGELHYIVIFQRMENVPQVIPATVYKEKSQPRV